MKRLMLIFGMSLAAPLAHADVSDSGNLLIGGQAVVQGSMTVAGNAFGVGASTLAVTGGKIGIGTASPSSKLHVVDGDIRISTTTGSRGIVFQDGTTQTTASGGSSQARSTAAVSFTDSYNTTSTSWVTFARSTLTLTLSATRPIGVSFDCNCRGGIDDQQCAMAFTIDGSWVDGQSASVGIFDTQHLKSTGARTPLYWRHVTSNTYSAGNHTVVLFFKTSTSTLTLNHSNTQVCQYLLEEM